MARGGLTPFLRPCRGPAVLAAVLLACAGAVNLPDSECAGVRRVRVKSPGFGPAEAVFRAIHRTDACRVGLRTGWSARLAATSAATIGGAIRMPSP